MDHHPTERGGGQKRKRGQRRSKQKARQALLSKPYSDLTWEEKLALEDIQRRHTAHLERSRAAPSRTAADPPTPRNTTAVRGVFSFL